MFSLNEGMRYLWYNQPTDMRKSYYSLSGIVTNVLGRDPCNGDVYIFMNKSRNRIKLLHWEPGGLVIYSKLLEAGTFGHPDAVSKDAISGTIEWRDLVLIVEGIIENTIRPLAHGRKNYLFWGNDASAYRAAIVYSLIGTCKAAGVEPRLWMEDALRQIPYYLRDGRDLTGLLPRAWAARNNQLVNE